MSEMASQITGVSTVCSTFCSCADQRKHQSFTRLASVRGLHRWAVDSSHKGPVTRKIVSIGWRHHVFLLMTASKRSKGPFSSWKLPQHSQQRCLLNQSRDLLILFWLPWQTELSQVLHITLKRKFCHFQRSFRYWLYRKCRFHLRHYRFIAHAIHSNVKWITNVNRMLSRFWRSA